MISDDINQDKLIDDIEAQLEILIAIAADNAILNEQLRLLNEARDHILALQHDIERLADMLDGDVDEQMLRIVERPESDQ